MAHQLTDVAQWLNTARIELENDPGRKWVHDQIQFHGFQFLDDYINMVRAGPKDQSLIEMVKTPARKRNTTRRAQAAVASSTKLRGLAAQLKQETRPVTNNVLQALINAKDSLNDDNTTHYGTTTSTMDSIGPKDIKDKVLSEESTASAIPSLPGATLEHPTDLSVIAESEESSDRAPYFPCEHSGNVATSQPQPVSLPTEIHDLDHVHNISEHHSSAPLLLSKSSSALTASKSTPLGSSSRPAVAHVEVLPPRSSTPPPVAQSPPTLSQRGSTYTSAPSNISHIRETSANPASAPTTQPKKPVSAASGPNFTMTPGAGLTGGSTAGKRTSWLQRAKETKLDFGKRVSAAPGSSSGPVDLSAAHVGNVVNEPSALRTLKRSKDFIAGGATASPRKIDGSHKFARLEGEHAPDAMLVDQPESEADMDPILDDDSDAHDEDYVHTFKRALQTVRHQSKSAKSLGGELAADAERRLLGEERLRREEEEEEEERLREAERRRQEEAVRLEAERMRAEAEAAAAERERARQEELLREHERREAEEKARKEAEERTRREEERRRVEKEEQVRREAEERRRHMEEEKARKAAEVKARREAEDRARREEEERVRREAEEKAEAEERERLRRAAEQKAQEEAEARRRAKEKARQEAEERARREAEEQARLEAQERARKDEEDRVRREAEEQRRRKAEIARREAEERARLELEAKAHEEELRRKSFETRSKAAQALGSRMSVSDLAEPGTSQTIQQKARSSTSTTPPDSPPDRPLSQQTKASKPLVLGSGTVFSKPKLATSEAARQPGASEPVAVKDAFKLPTSNIFQNTKSVPISRSSPTEMAGFNNKGLSAQSTVESISDSIFDKASTQETDATSLDSQAMGRSQVRFRDPSADGRSSEGAASRRSWQVPPEATETQVWDMMFGGATKDTWSTASHKGDTAHGPDLADDDDEDVVGDAMDIDDTDERVPDEFEDGREDAWESDNGSQLKRRGSDVDLEDIAATGQPTIALVKKPIGQPSFEPTSNEAPPTLFGQVTKFAANVFGSVKKPKVGEPFKGMQLATTAAKKEQDERDKKTNRQKDTRPLVTKKVDEDKARAEDEQKRVRDEAEKRKREREENTDKRPLKLPTKKGGEDDTKKRKLPIPSDKKVAPVIKKPVPKDTTAGPSRPPTAIGKPKAGILKQQSTTSIRPVASSNSQGTLASSTSTKPVAPPSTLMGPPTKSKGKAKDTEDLASTKPAQKQTKALTQTQPPRLAQPESENIELPDIASEYSDSDDEDRKKFQGPEWAQSPNLRDTLQQMSTINPDDIFGQIQPLQMEQIFTTRTSRFRARTSSAMWTGTDELTAEEEREYAIRMGYR